jgi:hypothetical protein
MDIFPGLRHRRLRTDETVQEGPASSDRKGCIAIVDALLTLTSARRGPDGLGRLDR